MVVLNLKDIILKISEELSLKDAAREEVIKSSRSIVKASGEVIAAIHGEELSKAEDMLKNLKEAVSRALTIPIEHPELLYRGPLSLALQEYSEACILLSLVKDGRFPTPEELNVPYVCYLSGLADALGELRRWCLDLIRRDRVERAEEVLALIDEVYLALRMVYHLKALIPGFRRRCDIARRIAEETRSDVTIASQRKMLRDSIIRLEKQLKNVGGSLGNLRLRGLGG